MKLKLGTLAPPKCVGPLIILIVSKMLPDTTGSEHYNRVKSIPLLVLTRTEHQLHKTGLIAGQGN